VARNAGLLPGERWPRGLARGHGQIGMTGTRAAKLGGVSVTEPAAEPPLDTGVAHPARIYDYRLGGKDNLAADRAAGDYGTAVRPEIIPRVRANRRFLGRGPVPGWPARCGVARKP
jgi:S-adenosyl methyltransferase